MSEAPPQWLARDDRPNNADDAGAVLRSWRLSSGQTQAAIAGLLRTSQQHLSQIEKGVRPLSLEQRRTIVAELGIPAEELGLSTSHSREDLAGAESAVTASTLEWRSQRRWLNRHRSELSRLAVDLYPAQQRILRTPVITGQDWLPDAPVDLRGIGLSLDEQAQRTTVSGSELESARVRPLRAPGVRFDCYTAAVKHLDPPQLFESRPSYRLLGGSPGAGHLNFGLGTYFDKLNVSEAVGHEIAAVCMSDPAVLAKSGASLRGRLPFRELISDPFDPHQRAVLPAITTLTIRLRRFPAEPSFLLHWRDPARVATAGGMYDVIPAGEFQPSNLDLWDRRNDFDLWRNIIREYSEELLGTPEHDGSRSQPIDYNGWPLFQQFEAAFAAGTVTAHVLGVGLDALTLAATILTVVVIDDDVFRGAFDGGVRYNEEGEIVGVGDNPLEGVPFTESSIQRMLDHEPLASPGAACLALAWRHRKALIGA